MLIRADEIDCYYGSNKILDTINLSAKNGELLGVIGPNGSGKSSLIKCMSRILRPNVGTVFINEKDICTYKTREIAREVAAVPQDSNITFSFTALETVLMGRTPHLGRFESEGAGDMDIALRSMEMTNTLHLADRQVNELSGGERQRVIISRALAQQPKVMFLDEPTANLDINHKIEILDLLKSLCHRKGLIVIVAIHDLNLAAQYCDSLVMLDNGRITSKGTPEEVLTTENVETVFSVRVLVKRHPATGFLNITLLPAEKRAVGNKEFTIHIICGGGTGGETIHLLYSSGYKVSTGVLNALDSDYEIAQSLGIPMVSEAPFSPITAESHSANLDLIVLADAVVLTNTPIGHGNLKNVEAASFALEQEKRLLLLKATNDDQHDHGIDLDVFNNLIDAGATSVDSQESLLNIIREFEKGN